jgi:hypothetical protein
MMNTWQFNAGMSRHWRTGCLLLAFCLGVLLSARSAMAETNGVPQIRFLHLKLKDQAISLVSAETRPGKLKPPLASSPADLQYELVSDSNKVLWTGVTPDPAVRHLEYEDPPESGKLARKMVVLSEVEFVVRVPVVERAIRVDFYRLETSVSGEKALNGVARRLLGSIDVR